MTFWDTLLPAAFTCGASAVILFSLVYLIFKFTGGYRFMAILNLLIIGFAFLIRFCNGGNLDPVNKYHQGNWMEDYFVPIMSLSVAGGIIFTGDSWWDGFKKNFFVTFVAVSVIYLCSNNGKSGGAYFFVIPVLSLVGSIVGWFKTERY